MKIILSVLTLFILVAINNDQKLEHVLEDNRIYTGRLAEKIARASKAVNGSLGMVVVSTGLFMTSAIVYFGLVTSYVDIPVYTGIVLAYCGLEVIEMALVVSCLVFFKLYILEKGCIWFSKIKLLATYMVMMLGFVLIIIR